MTANLSKDTKTLRMQVWLEAWTRTAQSDSCISLDTPTTFADRCLKDFDHRFVPYTETVPPLPPDEEYKEIEQE